MNDRELLEYIAAQVGNLTKDVAEVKTDIKQVNTRLDKVDNQLTKIEIDHGKKLEALFDGYKQNTKLLEGIQEEVARHEEVIIKRVK